MGIVVGCWPGRRSRPRPRASRLAWIGLVFIVFAGSFEGFLWHAIKNRPRLWEASAVVADTRMLAGTLDGERRIAEMIGLAESRAVREKAAETLRRRVGIGYPENILSTLKVERMGNSDLVSIKVVSESEIHARSAADVLTFGFVQRGQGLGRDARTIKVIQAAETGQVDTLGSRVTLFLFGWPVLMVLIGLDAGYLLGRNLSTRRKRA